MKILVKCAAIVASSLVLGALFFSCTLAKVEVKPTVEEMSIAVVEDSSMKMTHYAPIDLMQWNVLVLDTENTKRTIDWIASLRAGYEKYKFAEGIIDTDIKQIKSYQDVRLKKVFKNVSYEAKADEHYDLVILRDYIVEPGNRSGALTTTSLLYWFVYPATADMTIAQGCKYLSRGRYEATGYGTIPYPARALAVSESNKSAVEAMNVLLEGGLDVYNYTGAGAPQAAATSTVAPAAATENTAAAPQASTAAPAPAAADSGSTTTATSGSENAPAAAAGQSDAMRKRLQQMKGSE